MTRNGALTEKYAYDQSGRRVEQRRAYCGLGDNTDGRLYYNEQGRLARAGDVSFSYDARGALAERPDTQGVSKFTYGDGDARTVLQSAHLSTGEKIYYRYGKDNPLGPAERYKNDRLTHQYRWLDPLRLAAWLDHEHALEYRFAYDHSGVLDRVLLLPLAAAREADAGSDWLAALVMRDRREKLHEMMNRAGGRLELFCGCDQVGAPRVFTDTSGRLIKETLRDSFGVPVSDSLPELFMPVGFAGGLADPDTGLTRFGWRDYDPKVGRFTAPDPVRDMRGDGDIYDYCMDDPVNLVDPTGLASGSFKLGAGPAKLYDIGQEMGLHLGVYGAWTAAFLADKIRNIADRLKGADDNPDHQEARNAIRKIEPAVRSVHKLGKVPSSVEDVKDIQDAEKRLWGKKHD